MNLKLLLEYLVIKLLGHRAKIRIIKTKWLWKRSKEGKVVIYKHRLFDYVKYFALYEYGVEGAIDEVLEAPVIVSINRIFKDESK